MTDPKIKTVGQLIDAYKSGQRLFVELEFENNESFHGQNLSGSTFKNCWFIVDFTNSNLEDCIFIESNLKTSDFRNSNLKGATIKNCLVESTRWKGAAIDNLNFENNFHYGATVGQSDFVNHFINHD